MLPTLIKDLAVPLLVKTLAPTSRRIITNGTSGAVGFGITSGSISELEGALMVLSSFLIEIIISNFEKSRTRKKILRGEY